ncbi:MAG TPA: FAD-dependent monooxygenase [Hyphomicrobiaceae bacterium]|nr:FAD-dependent monooxygenase [Hyphomicrobiaceae bacterium]
MATNNDRDADVVIVGASFAGQALALALARMLGPEIRIMIADRGGPAGADAADPRAFALSHASRQMLEVLGVWQRIASEAQPIEQIEITDSFLDAGVRPVLLSYDNTVENGVRASSIMPAAALAAALSAAVEGERSIAIRRQSEISGFAIDEFGATLALAGGDFVRATLAVAADGRNSTLRRAAGIKIVGWHHPQIGIVTVVSHERPHEGVAVQHFLPGGPFAILPLKGSRSCVTWTEHEDVGRRIMALDEGAFLAEVDKRFGGRLGRLSLEGPRRCWRLKMHLARSYVTKRVALVGDAAHSVHPIAGQGLNLAFRDVAALAEVVIEAARLGLDLGDATMLQRYERWRRFDSAVSAATFDALNRLFSRDVALLRSMREAGLGMVDRLPELKRLLVNEAAGLAGELPRLLKGERV